jgi:SAM-dependent methyltransferase
MTNRNPHSDGYLTDIRDFWWNTDFVALMAKRWELEKIHSMLDVGCGVGHWGQMLLPYLSKDAKLTGIDPETQWIEAAKERALKKDLNTQYLIGSAEKIPFPDESFDMVTCQTVLIHVKDIDIVIKEMLRILKPGGLFAVSEPNNSVSCLIFNNLNFNSPIDETLDLIRFHLTTARGKAALDEGHNDFGDLIPLSFAKASLKNIKVYLSDLADYFIPPYVTPREQAIVNATEFPSQESWDTEKVKSIRYFLASGGTEEEFARVWNAVVKKAKIKINGLKNKTYSTAGGEMLYLISGIK